MFNGGGCKEHDASLGEDQIHVLHDLINNRGLALEITGRREKYTEQSDRLHWITY